MNAEWRVLIVKFGIQNAEFGIKEMFNWFYLQIKPADIFHNSAFRIPHSELI